MKNPKISVNLNYQEIQDLLSALSIFARSLENETRPHMKSPDTLDSVHRLGDKLWRFSDRISKMKRASK